MGFLNKMKAALGSSQSSEETIDSNYIEKIINEIENEPFAISESNVIYAGLGELAGYHYLHTVIVGTFNIKTNKGAELTIEGTDFELKLKSDMMELESEFSNVSNRSVTKIDFELDEEALPNMVKTKIQSLKLSAKKEQVTFSIVNIISDEEE